MAGTTSIVETYLERMVAHDFGAMAACLAEDVVRVGPYGDTYTPRDVYVAMLRDLMPSLPGYSMTISRVVEVPEERLVLVELSEVVEIGEAPLTTPEALVFELNEAGLIAHIAIYIQTLPTNAADDSASRLTPGPDTDPPVAPGVDESGAVALVREFLDAWEPPPHDEWVVTDVRRFAWGWAVWWAGRRHAEGNRDADVHRGSGPYLVDAASGAVALAGTAHPVEHYIDLWRSGQWPEVSTGV